MSIIRDGNQSVYIDGILPSLNLDFANSQKLDPRITFTRGSIGTFVNKNGLIETAQANVPRFDYDPISGECRGLLIEEQRTNLLTYSEDCSNVIWNKSDVSVSTNQIISPDGNLTADKIIISTGVNVSHIITQTSATITAGSTVTFSIFVKYNDWSNIRLQVFGNTITADTFYGRFNIQTGTVVSSNVGGSATVISTSITPFPNGWYRLSITGTVNSTDTSVRGRVSFVYAPTNTVTFTGDGVSSYYMWGSQLEAGAFPTSYIPTTASTVTRSADNASMTGTNFSSWYNQIGYTILSTHILPEKNNVYFPRIWNISTSTDVDRLNHYIDINQAHIGFSAIENNSYTQADIRSTSGFSPGKKMKMITRFEVDDTSLFINGIFIGRDNKVSYPNVTRTSMNIGSSHNNNSYLNSTIANIVFYSKALPDAQLQYLTQ